MHIYVCIYVHTYVDIDTYTEILIFSPSLEQKWGGLLLRPASGLAFNFQTQG